MQVPRPVEGVCATLVMLMFSYQLGQLDDAVKNMTSAN